MKSVDLLTGTVVHPQRTEERNVCRVHWGSTFTAVGATDDEAAETARAIYQGCYDGIRRTLGL